MIFAACLAGAHPLAPRFLTNRQGSPLDSERAMSPELLSFIKDVSIIVAGAVTLAGLFASGWEYRKKNRADRADHFVQLRRRFLDDQDFRRILDGLASDDPSLAEIPKQERRNFLGFLEEVGLMVSSRLVRPDVAWCMFGRYVDLASKSRHLWQDLDPDSGYWTVFRQTVKLMQEEGSRRRNRQVKF